MPQERSQNRTVEQVVDVPVPQIEEEFVEVIQLVPPERISDRHGRANREVVRSIPMERIPERVVEQIVDRRETQVTKKTTKIQKISQEVENTQYQLQTVS